MLKILIGCEESQEVAKAFRALGHEAYSCDILPCSGGHPEWHLQMDVIDAIQTSPFIVSVNFNQFIEFDGRKWDGIIIHPPCTKVSVSGNGT